SGRARRRARAVAAAARGARQRAGCRDRSRPLQSAASHRITPMTDLTVTELAARLAAGDLRAIDVTRAYLDRIAAHDPSLHAFQTVDRDGALARAESLDQARVARP